MTTVLVNLTNNHIVITLIRIHPSRKSLKFCLKYQRRTNSHPQGHPSIRNAHLTISINELLWPIRMNLYWGILTQYRSEHPEPSIKEPTSSSKVLTMTISELYNPTLALWEIKSQNIQFKWRDKSTLTPKKCTSNINKH